MAVRALRIYSYGSGDGAKESRGSRHDGEGADREGVERVGLEWPHEGDMNSILRCYACGKEEHIVWECPRMRCFRFVGTGPYIGGVWER